MGKPIYTPELAQRVLEALARTGSLRAVCKEVGINRDTVIGWVVDDKDGFATAYARAKDIGLDDLVDETLEISDAPPPLTALGATDSGAVAHSKLRIETRRWLAERMAPRRYGLKQDLALTGANGGPIETQVLIATGVPVVDDHTDLA
jgi:hypothetical protein